MNDHENGLRLLSDSPDPDDSAVVERLLRLAGHRPEVPALDAEIVKQAARAQWRQTVKAQRRRSYLLRGGGGLLAAAAGVLLALSLGLLNPRGPGAGESVATVEKMTGRALASSEATGSAALTMNGTLTAGTVVETEPSRAGAVSSRVALRLAGGASIRLDVDSRARLLSGNALFLERGALYADSGTPAAGPSLEIQTSLGVVSDIGTQFIVRLDPPGAPLTVPVREGKVILALAGESHEAIAGQQLTVQEDGSVETIDIPCSGSLWDWVVEVRPPFDFAGKTFGEVLAWAAREQGWRIVYADTSIQPRVESMVVDGHAEGLTPEEVVANSLLGSGLPVTYRLEYGVFTIERQAP